MAHSPVAAIRPKARFFFKPSEQDLLQLALLGKSDTETVMALHVSPSTVQNRWRTIYERVTATMPDLFPRDAVSGPLMQTRGVEKRRHLLAYLRHHPEELRPILAPHAPRHTKSVGVLKNSRRLVGQMIG